MKNFFFIVSCQNSENAHIYEDIKNRAYLGALTIGANFDFAINLKHLCAVK